MDIQGKLPLSETTIFTTMSSMAKEYQAINLGQGFPDFDCDQGLKDLLNLYTQEGRNQYAPMSGAQELRNAVANKVQLLYNKSIDPNKEICVTAGATQALFTAIQAFIGHGDEVIYFEPAYDSYKPSIQLAGGEAIPYTMKGPDFSIDWNRVADMVNEKTKMIIINSPHNPTGSILREEDMKALELIVQNRNIIVLSDEVYEHLVFDKNQHQSVLLYPKLLEQCLAVYSFGKTFHVTGWKIGYILGPENLMKAFKNVHQWNVFSVNSVSQYAIAKHLEDEDHYRSLPKFFEKKRDYLFEALKDSPLRATDSFGTYFQLYEYSQVSDLGDFDFAKFLTKKHGVASIPLSPFYTNPPDEKYIRLCFAKKEETLALAAQRLSSL